MKLWRWVLTLSVLLMAAGVYSPVLAEWVPIDDQVVIAQQVPFVERDLIRVNVTVENITADMIQGRLRLIFSPIDPTLPWPVNALVAGEDGNSPKPYFFIVTGQEYVFDSAEVSHVEMQFDAATLTKAQKANLLDLYLLHVEVNDESIDAQIFRKKISRTPEFVSGEATIEVMPVYVKARNTQGQAYIRDAAGELMICCGEIEETDVCFDCSSLKEDDFARVKPIIVTYIQEEEDVSFNSVPEFDPKAFRYARDVYAAVSLDDGLTWKRKNISRTSTKSSMTLDNDVAYPGDSESQNLAVAGHFVLVTWIDKYCRSGNPWDMEAADDIYQVTGSQKSKDYLEVTGDDEPRPDIGVRPFSCLWAARGVLELDPKSRDFGTIVWYRAEQLSSGRRDAIRNFTAGVEPLYRNSKPTPVKGTGGFAVTWQEDVKGLKTGKGEGPGEGMSGACVNHKTDIWYSFIDWEKFADIDPDFFPTSGGDDADPAGDSDGNSEYYCPNCSYVYDSEIDGIKFIDLPDDWICPVDGTSKSEFIKVAKPHALNRMSPPVPITDNAVCRDRIPESVYGYVHDPAVTDCDYYYEGGTNNQPLTWAELADDWACPQCGLTKGESFLADPVFIKNRNEGGPYCSQFSGNPRVDKEGNYAIPGTDAHIVAYYSQDGEWRDVDGRIVSSVPGAATIRADGTAWIGGKRVYWSGAALDGNTGASRPNLSLINWKGKTLALVAYEETKGMGTGSDKQVAAMEQAAPIPLVDMGDGTWEAGFTNADCRSCHYGYKVPRDRVIPVRDEYTCVNLKGGVWKTGLNAYFPYGGYPYITEDPVDSLPSGVTYDESNLVRCVKFEGDRGMYPRDWARTDANAYYALPDHMPGWHQAALDCTSCHLPYNTKDTDGDLIKDRADLCPGTPDGMTVDTYGCAETQSPDDPDNNKDEPERTRHGKNIYFHQFAFNSPETEAISHGGQINIPNQYGWAAAGSDDIHENARRVLLVPNPAYDPASGADVTLGILYKEGKDGQGAPADAILRLFRNGFDLQHMDPVPLNMSSSTPVWFQDPADAGNADGTGDNMSGDGSGDLIGNHKTPHIEYYYWSDDNLHDPSGFWLEDESGGKRWGDDGYSPVLRANPFENVFSTRLAIYGDTLVTGFAHCVNWSAGRNAKDHYDFYVRVSKDSGASWTQPINVSQLKNHDVTVSDCRVMLTHDTIDQPYPENPGIPANISQNGAAEVLEAGDFKNRNVLFVAVGTEVNIPEPNANEPEPEEPEIFLDVFYSKAAISGVHGGKDGDLTLTFDTFSKENPKYVEGSRPYLSPFGEETDNPETNYAGRIIPNRPNPAFPEFVEEFDWLAKGDARQGDVQMISNPYGTALYSIWAEALPIVEDDGRKHFQGSDVWFRKMFYAEPEAAFDGDVDGNGEVNDDDGRLILRSIGSTAYDSDFLWAGDYAPDFRITGADHNRWLVQFQKIKGQK